jgi:hypothetical protein
MKMLGFDRLRSKWHFVVICYAVGSCFAFRQNLLISEVEAITKLGQATARQAPGPRRHDDDQAIAP